MQENASIAILVNPENPLGTAEREDAEQAAHTIGRQFKVLTATTAREIDEAFSGIKVQRVGALIIPDRVPGATTGREPAGHLDTVKIPKSPGGKDVTCYLLPTSFGEKDASLLETARHREPSEPNPTVRT